MTPLISMVCHSWKHSNLNCREDGRNEREIIGLEVHKAQFKLVVHIKHLLNEYIFFIRCRKKIKFCTNPLKIEKLRKTYSDNK